MPVRVFVCLCGDIRQLEQTAVRVTGERMQSYEEELKVGAVNEVSVNK